MPVRFAPSWIACMIAASTIGLGMVAPSSAHRHEGHRKQAPPSRHAKPARPHPHPSTPGGSVAIPAAGLKVYCPTRSPLMIRKSTQGKGTIVTVICR